MSRVLALRGLASRIARTEITGEGAIRGLRRIGRSSTEEGGIVNQAKKYLGKFFGGTVKFLGWIIKPIISTISFSFTGLWGLIVQATTFIYNFDINITDQNIDQQLEVTKTIIAGQLGESLGNSVGYLACGIVPSASILAFNEPLALYLLKEVGEEALDEFAGNMQALIQLSFRLGIKNFFLSSYKNIRKSIKRWNLTASGKEKKAINSLFGGNITEAIKVWGEKESKPWSLSLKVEERIDRINNPVLQEFVEEFYDEFKDACVEAGYVVANGLDSWILQQQQEQDFSGNREELIEVTPDRNAPEETLIFSGTNNNVRSDITNALNTFQLVDNRDVGQIIGEPLIDSVRKPPVSLSLRIYLRGVKSPPWIYPSGGTAKRAQVTIPNVDKSKLDWSRIKLAVGGTNGFLWGRFLVVANLDDGNKITFFAGSESEGTSVVKKLIELSNANLTTLDIREEKKEGSRIKYSRLYKNPTKIYPASMTLINQNKILTIDEGVATARGIFKRRRYLIPLYPNQKPDEFELIVSELKRNNN